MGGSDVVTCLWIHFFILFIEYGSQHDAVTTGIPCCLLSASLVGTLGLFAFSFERDYWAHQAAM